MPDATDELVLPELTRGLRHFATPSALGSDHAVYFGPLLTARRAAADAALWTGRLAAFDALRLRGMWQEMLASLAAARYPRAGADRRALTAELEDATRRVGSALDDVERTAATVRAAADDAARRAAWDLWIAALRVLFTAADEAWGHVVPVLADSRGASGRWWRRVLGSGTR